MQPPPPSSAHTSTQLYRHPHMHQHATQDTTHTCEQTRVCIQHAHTYTYVDACIRTHTQPYFGPWSLLPPPHALSQQPMAPGAGPELGWVPTAPEPLRLPT